MDGGKYICQAWNSAVDSNGKVIVATKVHTLDIIGKELCFNTLGKSLF